MSLPAELLERAKTAGLRREDPHRWTPYDERGALSTAVVWAENPISPLWWCTARSEDDVTRLGGPARRLWGTEAEALNDWLTRNGYPPGANPVPLGSIQGAPSFAPPACCTPPENATVAERLYCAYNAGGPGLLKHEDVIRGERVTRGVKPFVFELTDDEVWGPRGGRRIPTRVLWRPSGTGLFRMVMPSGKPALYPYVEWHNDSEKLRYMTPDAWVGMGK